VTEYCKGKDLTARGFFSTADGLGEKLEFDNGATVNAMNIRYKNQLYVGVYKFNTHQLDFGFGKCRWNQDLVGGNECGYCVSRGWTGDG